MNRRFFGRKLAGVAAAMGISSTAKAAALIPERAVNAVELTIGKGLAYKTWFVLTDVRWLSGFDQIHVVAKFNVFDASGMDDTHYVKVLRLGRSPLWGEPLLVSDRVRIVGLAETNRDDHWQLAYEVRGFDNEWRMDHFLVSHGRPVVLLS